MPRPNVLLFIVDGLRTDALGCLGSPLGASPHTNAFAASGVTFSQAFCVHSVCMPTRASIATGRFPHTHGVWANGVPLRRTEVTLAQTLSDAGYATCASGKIHHEPQQPYRPFAPEITGPYYGFQEVHLSENHLGEEYVRFIEERYPALRDRALKRDRMPEEAHDLTWIADQAIGFMQRQAAAGQPFFCQCSFHELIPPCTPPPSYAGFYDPADMTVPELREDDLERRPPWYRQCYEGYVANGRQPDEPTLRQYIASAYDQLRFVDHQFGRLLQALQDSGVADNTVVLFTADHGLSLNDHWQWRHGPFLFDQVIHIPQIWRLPTSCGVDGPQARTGAPQRPAACSEQVEQVDIMPTILQHCGVDLPPGVQGQSLLPLLNGEEGARGRETVLIQERHAPDLAARGLDPLLVWQVGLRTPEWKLIHYVDYRDAGERFGGELYDLRNDPGEFVNLWGEAGYLAQRRELEAALMDRLARTQDPLPVNDWHY
jgi:arylsulfatase A-like enzyme